MKEQEVEGTQMVSEVENLKITPIGNDTVRIEAAAGYKLYSKILSRVVSVAEVSKKQVGQFEAIAE